MIANSYLGWLYTRIRFHFGCKLKLPGGELLRLGVTPRKIWYVWDAVAELDGQRVYGCRLLNKMYLNEIYRAICRQLQPNDIRLSFQPEYYYTPDGFLRHGLSGVFVDDVNEETPAHLMIETSPGNWQAHFRLSGDIKIDADLTCIQKYFCHMYKGDHGAVSAKHPRRFASPVDSGLLSIVSYAKPLDLKKVLADAKAFEGGQQPVVRSYSVLPNSGGAQIVTEASCLGVWQRALDRASQDMSCADYALGIYMAARGYSEGEILKAIINIRGDALFRKKGSTTQAYLEHTAMRAVEKVGNR